MYAYCPSNKMRKSKDLLIAFQKKKKKKEKKRKEQNTRKLSGIFI